MVGMGGYFEEVREMGGYFEEVRESNLNDFSRWRIKLLALITVYLNLYPIEEFLQA